MSKPSEFSNGLERSSSGSIVPWYIKLGGAAIGLIVAVMVVNWLIGTLWAFIRFGVIVAIIISLAGLIFSRRS